MVESRAASETVDILHVEDDAEWAALTQVWIENRGWSVAHARTYAQMIGYLNSRPLPRCLLLDLSLEDADGLDVCGRLKDSPVWQGLPIVILTGRRRTSSCQCLERKALYRVLKDQGPETEAELCAALNAILAQQERSLGLVDADDLRLDPRGGKVLQSGRPIAALEAGPFAALLAMVRASPAPVPDERLHTIFLSRRPYRRQDPELAVRLTVRNYVYQLRRQLGSVGVRLVRAGEGYAYRPFLNKTAQDRFQID
jgi:DNA-binding response OmpR family regulator